MMDWKSVLGKLAPTVATVLGGPAAGLAVGALTSALGVQSADDVKKIIEDGQLTGDQIAAIRQAELQIKAKEQELGLNFEQLAVEDRKSAREMQVATSSNVPPILATLVMLGFGLVITFKLTGIAIPADPMLQDLITTLRDAVILVLGYYFGSSRGSQIKDQIIHKMSNGDDTRSVS